MEKMPKKCLTIFPIPYIINSAADKGSGQMNLMGYSLSLIHILELVEKAGVMVTPGSAFGPSGEGYVRLALVQDEEVIHEAVQAVKESGVLERSL